MIGSLPRKSKIRVLEHTRDRLVLFLPPGREGVEVAGGMAAVGANGVNDYSGAVYRLWRDGSDAWWNLGRFMPSDPGAYDNFGHSLAVSGSLLVVGAFMDDVDGVADSGSAYLFAHPVSPCVEP